MWPTINYSLTRENVDNFNTILDRVEERIDRLNERVKFVETDDSAFNEEFPGIIDFLYEASELSENSEKQFEKRFIKLAQKLWDLGICLSFGILSLISIFVIRLGTIVKQKKKKNLFKEIILNNYITR